MWQRRQPLRDWVPHATLWLALAAALTACVTTRTLTPSPKSTEGALASASPPGATESLTGEAAPATGLSVTAAPTQNVELTLNPAEQEAANALRDFLTQLHVRRYSEAAALYGGSYDELQATLGLGGGTLEHAVLWQRICDEYFLQCLLPKDVDLERHTDTSIDFRVSFFNPDGSTFTLGPCCGASETDMPPRSDFPFRVIMFAGRYVILGTPPYVP